MIVYLDYFITNALDPLDNWEKYGTEFEALVGNYYELRNERIDIIINQSDGLCTYKIAIDEGQEVYELLSDRKLKPEIQVLPKIALYIKVK